MKFTSVPAGFSSFRTPLVYAFDAGGAARDITFAVVDTESGATIGTLRLHAVAGEIDIAPVLRRAARCRLPDRVSGCGVVETGGRVKVRVEAEGTASPVRTFIAAEVAGDLLYKSLSTQYARRTIAPGEFDLIGYFAMPEAVVGVVIEALDDTGAAVGRIAVTLPDGGQRTVAVTAGGFDTPPVRMRVVINVDGEAATVVDYDVEENTRGARRVAWINRHGAPELYTFPACRQTEVEAVRERIGTAAGGRGSVVTDVDSALRLVSAYEPQAQLLALAGIVASPDVRLVCGDTLRPVCPAADGKATVTHGEPSLFELELHPAGKEVRL